MVRLSFSCGAGRPFAYPPSRAWPGAPRTWRYYARHLPFVLRCRAVALLVVALARPARLSTTAATNAEGIDIVLAIDVSGSMLARAGLPARPHHGGQGGAASFVPIASATASAWWFFAAKPTPRAPSPPTRDAANPAWPCAQRLVEDGTAIGNGLATAINRLRESDAKSKVVILLTDGENNAGQIAPLTAAASPRPRESGSTPSGWARRARRPTFVDMFVRSPTAWPR